MAVNNYLNVEPLSLEIANEMAEKMTNENSYDGILLEEELLLNIKYGFIVVTHLMTFLESFLNTILNRSLGINDESVLSKNIEKKLEFLCCVYKKEITAIYRIPEYRTYKRIRKVRNEMIHYKRSYVGESIQLPRIKFGNSYADTVFTQKEMKRCIGDFVKLADEIANVFGLKTFHNIPIIASDGRDELVNYVYDPKSVDIDPNRNMDDSNQREQWSLTHSDNNSSYRKLKNEELYELREKYYHKCRNIEMTFQYNSSAVSIDDLNTYHLLIEDLIAINKEIAERIEKSEYWMQMMLRSALGYAQLYPMVKRQKAFVIVNLYRNYEVFSDPQLIARCQVPYAENTKLRDLFIQLGLGNQEFNIVDANTLQYKFIHVPFYDNGETVYWDLRYENITIDQYLTIYHCNEINVLPFDYHAIGGIGNTIPELFTELLDFVNEFMEAQPFLSSILSNVIAGLICTGVMNCVREVKEFASRGANYSAILKYLETKPEWDERELMKKWKINSQENLEFIMFGMGYIKQNGKYCKWK